MKNVNNPYHPSVQGAVFSLDDADALTTIKEGLHHEIEDFVKLELTAEHMLHEEAMRVRDYVAGDAKTFWDDLKTELLYWELTAGSLLLRAADPTQAEWQRGGWWLASVKDGKYH